MSAGQTLNQRRLRRLLISWLADPRACQRADDGSVRIPATRQRRVLMPPELVRFGLQQGLLCETNEGAIHPDEAVAHAWCKRRQAGQRGDDPYLAQHREMAHREVFDDSGERVHVDVNLARSPLMRLYRRKDGQGRRMISAVHMAAGERLREDYARSGMGRVSTSDWTGLPMSARTRGAHPGLTTSEVAMDARKRVMDALETVGPMLDRLLFAILIREENLSAQEKARHWPARSARIMLQLALTRLAQHYGLPA